MIKLSFIFLITCVLQIVICLDYDGWLNIKMEHSLNCKNGKYCPRGSITLKSIRAGTAIIDQITFNQHDLKALEDLAEVDGFYTIRALISSADSKEIEVFSSVKAKLFLESGLSDIISAWVLPNGEVIAVSFQVTNSSMINNSINDNKPKSNFYIHHVDQAPVPDTASYIQKLEREREAREKGDVKDNRSFIAKYWMYIVPIVIFVMISGATNPEPAGQASR